MVNLAYLKNVGGGWWWYDDSHQDRSYLKLHLSELQVTTELQLCYNVTSQFEFDLTILVQSTYLLTIFR